MAFILVLLALWELGCQVVRLTGAVTRLLLTCVLVLPGNLLPGRVRASALNVSHALHIG